MFTSIYNDFKKINTEIKKQCLIQENYHLNSSDKLVLLLEDRRYFFHPGFDILSIARVCWKKFTGIKRPGGASTIEQQLVRTITNRREYSIRRKLREITLSTLISLKYKKIVLLKTYLNIAYFGANLNGIDSVSYKVFRKNNSTLNIQEASQIAALLKYPMPLTETPAWQQKMIFRKNYGLYLHKKENIFSINYIKNYVDLNK